MTTEYNIRKCGDGWTLDIPFPDEVVSLFFHSAINAHLVLNILRYDERNQNPADPFPITPKCGLIKKEIMREMGGRPYWHVGMRDESEAPHWAILDPHIAKHIEDYGYGETWVAYEYPPAHIDREAWEPCKACSDEYSQKISSYLERFHGCATSTVRVVNTDFCPCCGRPLTEEAWAMLEKRLRGD